MPDSMWQLVTAEDVAAYTVTVCIEMLARVPENPRGTAFGSRTGPERDRLRFNRADEFWLFRMFRDSHRIVPHAWYILRMKYPGSR
jgi:hypothetical protein